MRRVVLLTLVKDVAQVILDLSCAVEKWRAHETEKLDLSSAEEYECTCHVYGQTHKYKQQLQSTKQLIKEDETPVHLSRLWTDTQVWIQKPNGPRKKGTSCVNLPLSPMKVSVTLLLCSCGLVFCFVFCLGCVLVFLCFGCFLRVVFCVSLCDSVMTL